MALKNNGPEKYNYRNGSLPLSQAKTLLDRASVGIRERAETAEEAEGYRSYLDQTIANIHTQIEEAEAVADSRGTLPEDDKPEIFMSDLLENIDLGIDFFHDTYPGLAPDEIDDDRYRALSDMDRAMQSAYMGVVYEAQGGELDSPVTNT